MDDILNIAKSILSTVAPTVASALGGPLSGMAVKSIIQALGLSPDTPQEDVLKEVTNSSPETLLKLKELENSFSAQMKQLEIDLKKLETDDRNSARNREIQVKDNTTKYLAFLIVFLYAAIQIWLVSGQVLPAEMREIVMRALGTLDAIISMIFGYYFGSSIGSAQKTTQIQSMIEAK